ncbi:MAG: SH3 domain-containing protein [Spirochaetes bacterium]|nr:SH3 domain-containing protein [Spirochaetota bacterium]
MALFEKAILAIISLSVLFFSMPLRAAEMKVKYSTGESVIVRSKADEKSKPIERLSKGEAVLFLGEISGNRSRITINKKEHNEPWIKIRTAKTGSQNEGWVYSPLLADKPILTKRFAVIAFTDTTEVSEDWNWFFHDITTAFKGTDIHVIHVTKESHLAIGPPAAPFDIIDLSEYLKKNGSGYLCYKNGEIKYVPYDTSDQTIRIAKEFFGRR